MVSATEAAANAQTELGTALGAGIANISYSATVRFTKYVRVVLPLDGYVFWVKASELTESALFNSGAFNAVTPGQSAALQTAAFTMDVAGSIHYETTDNQDEAATYSANRVVFTTQTEVENLMQVSPTVAYIGTFDGVQFMFSRRADFYEQAGVHHYVGDAVYSTMATQIIDNPALLDVSNVVVSNSLPIWLTLNKFFPVYPSKLVPQNLPPPYAAVHIEPSATAAFSLPGLDQNSNSTQLCRDRVKVTMYGCRNYTAVDFLNYVIAYMTNGGNLGLLLTGAGGFPTIRDDKEGQVETQTLAEKKAIEFEVSYYQSRVLNVARKYIMSAFCSLSITGVA